MSIEEIIDYMYKNGECKTPDIIINYMFLESYYNGNEMGKILYNKYYINSPNVCTDVRKWMLKFKKLICSFENNGNLTKKNPILISNGRYKFIRNGRHRIACCLYFNEKKLHVALSNRYINRPKTLMVEDFGRMKQFTEEETKILIDKCKGIHEKFRKR